MNGVLIFDVKVHLDNRGQFIKFLDCDQLLESGFGNLEEVFFSRSKPGVVRGMHFQAGPSSNHKIIHVIAGQVFDVLLDLRPDSSTYLEMFSLELSDLNPKTLLIPPGVAHGFQALSPTTMIYISDKSFDTQFDLGVNVMSLNIEWPHTITEISPKDLSLPSLEEYLTL